MGSVRNINCQPDGDFMTTLNLKDGDVFLVFPAFRNHDIAITFTHPCSITPLVLPLHTMCDLYSPTLVARPQFIGMAKQVYLAVEVVSKKAELKKLESELKEMKTHSAKARTAAKRACAALEAENTPAEEPTKKGEHTTKKKRKHTTEETDLERLKTEADDLAGEVEALEADIANLKAQVNAKQIELKEAKKAGDCAIFGDLQLADGGDMDEVSIDGK